MSGKHHKKRLEESSSSSSSDSEDEYVKKTETIETVEKKHKRRDKKEKSSSSSSSDSDEDRKDKKCKEKSRSRSSSRSSCSSNGHKKYDFCDIYNYMKNRLVEDKDLMVAGSSAYSNRTDVQSDVIPVNHGIDYDTQVINYNVDYIKYGSPFFVRESGVYILFFIVSIDTAAQFTVFVNGNVVPITCVGSNAGAGQIVNRAMLQLKENDNIIYRNYISSVNSIESNTYAGGSNKGNSTTGLIMKIAPYCNPYPSCDDWKEFMHCLSHSKKRLFKALQDKLVCDHELMVKGFNVTGTFYTKNAQSVTLEGDIAFDTTSTVQGLTWNNSTPQQIVIGEDGIYKLFFVLTTNTACQFAMTVNGVAVETTTQGTNKGAGQISSRAILTLQKNDIVTVRNHSSLLGTVMISQNAGGLASTVSGILTVFKIAPVCKPVPKEVPCRLAKKLSCLYDTFKTYLLGKEELQIGGSPSYFSLANNALQSVNQNEPFYYSTIGVKSNTEYRPGDYTLTIEKSGVYDIFADIATNEPLQMSLFVNGVATPDTVFGRDSGANRCIVRQFCTLKKGDVISINNYITASPSVKTVENSGGNYIGNSVLFMAFMLRPLCA